MDEQKNRRREFGDWQTPFDLAKTTCAKLLELNVIPATIIEPTCGIGAFVIAAKEIFPNSPDIRGFDVNPEHIAFLKDKLARSTAANVTVQQANFFSHDWEGEISRLTEPVLVLGNLPWVTNSQQGAIGGQNLPKKSNYQRLSGYDAMTGRANFDISETMLSTMVRWFRGKAGAVGMLIKTAVARKILSQTAGEGFDIVSASIYKIDSKRHFGASVDACLLIIIFGKDCLKSDLTYSVYPSFDSDICTQVGRRGRILVGDLKSFDEGQRLLATSPQKWRSGVKHDASSIMELTSTAAGLANGLGEIVDIEDAYLFPLMKGSDVGSDKPWRKKYALVTQRFVGQNTAEIEALAPRTWRYLIENAARLDSRGSSIYLNNPRFSVFGVGDYTFKSWKIAICALYKKLEFRLYGPINGKPVLFDDTTYFIGFDTAEEASAVLDQLNSTALKALLRSMIFWDEKRPIKTAVLNAVDYSKVSKSDF